MALIRKSARRRKLCKRFTQALDLAPPVGPRGGNWLGQNHAKSDNKSRESEHPMEGNYYRNAEHIWNIPLECGHIFTFHAGKSSIRSAHLGYEYLEILGVRRMPNQDKPRS